MKAPTKIKTEAVSAAPATFFRADIFALQAVRDGTANEGQQKRALKWILERACGMTDDSFRADNARLTDYLIGRQSVGRMVLDLLNARIISNE
jgi:hypothetical protein